jgi:hypothetical protein
MILNKKENSPYNSRLSDPRTYGGKERFRTWSRVVTENWRRSGSPFWLRSSVPQYPDFPVARPYLRSNATCNRLWTFSFVLSALLVLLFLIGHTTATRIASPLNVFALALIT